MTAAVCTQDEITTISVDITGGVGASATLVHACDGENARRGSSRRGEVYDKELAGFEGGARGAIGEKWTGG